MKAEERFIQQLNEALFLFSDYANYCELHEWDNTNCTDDTNKGDKDNVFLVLEESKF